MSTMKTRKTTGVSTESKAVTGRKKGYVMENATLFAASSAMLCGNPAAAVQIMKNAI